MTGKRTMWLTVAIVATLGLFSGCGKKPEAKQQDAAEQKNFRFSYSIFFPPTHIQCKTAVAWAEEIEKRSGGRVKIDVHPGGSLTPAKQVYDGVVNGVSQIGMSCFAYTRGNFPLMEGVDLPLGYPNGMVATKAANAMVNKYMPKELSGVEVLYIHAHGPGVFASKKPAKTLADIKGQKVRATGLSSKVVEALGGVPVGMSQGETAEALRKGVVEATLCPIETLKGWKQGEAVDGVTELPGVGYTTAMFVVMNKEAWGEMPQDLQELFSSVSSEWIEKHGAAWDQADAEGLAYVKELGKPIYTLSEADAAQAQAAVKPILDDYVAKTKEKGLPGDQFLKDLQEYIKNYK